MADREEDGRFAKGNRIWEAGLGRGNGHPRKFETADDLWQAAVGYFEWVESNPLKQDNLVTYQGTAHHEPTAKMRAMTQTGLCLFLGVSKETWHGWKNPAHHLHRPDLMDVIEQIEAVIWEQKFTGAAADLLNSNIIARELGLADRREMTGGINLTVTQEDAEL